MSLAFIGQELNIYAGSIFLLLGTVGNGMNIFILSTVRNYRNTPCTFYFLVAAIHNILYILLNLPARISNAATGVDLTRYSIVWCRANAYFIGYLGLTSFTCSCLATIDQFFVTSRIVYVRGFSKIQRTYRILLIVMIVWSLHGIPVLIFNDISPVTGRCGSTNRIYSSYIPIYILLFQSFIPSIIMTLFGYMTYRSIRQTRVLVEQRADRQLVRMTLGQVILVLISMVPVGSIFAYNLITSTFTKDLDRQRAETFSTTVLILVSYFYYVGSFYIFLISSQRFRQTVKDRLLRYYRRNQIIPILRPTF